jgi:hypothetical protein
MLLRVSPLKAAASYDTAALKDPVAKPAVMTTRRLAEMPEPARHTTELSDAQSDASHADALTRADTLVEYVPNPDPETVTLTLPVTTTFIRITLEICGTS